MSYTGQAYGSAAIGGYFAVPYLTEWLRYVAQPLMRFRQVCDVKEAIGTRRGATFNWDIISNIATAGSTLTESSTIALTSFTIAQGTLTVTEFGNAIPLTRKLREMSKYDVEEVIRKTLANDMAKTIDKYIMQSCIAQTPFIFQASGAGGTDTANAVLTTTGTGSSAAAATSWLHTGHIISIVDQMKELNIPAFDGENYLCIAHPSTLSNLRAQMIPVMQYTESGLGRILSGEIGRFEGVRFIEQTNCNKVTPTNAGAGSWAAFIGGEAVIEAISVPEEIIEKEVTDFGRSLGLAWYMIAGYGLPFPATDTTNTRIAMWWPNNSSPTATTY